jgi:hypothetical protein
VRHRHVPLRGGDGSRECRVRVAVDEHHVRRELLELRLECGEHARCLARERAVVHAELARGSGHAELLEEDPRQLVVVVLAGVDDQLLVALTQQPGDCCRFYELRSITYDGDDAHGIRRSMMLRRAARTGAGAVRAVARLAASAGSHVAWWIDYNSGGRGRQDEPKQPPQRKG